MHRLIAVSLLTAASSLVAGSVSAQEWSGFYFGAHTGYGWGDSSLRNEHNNGEIDPVDEGLDYIRGNCLNISEDAIADIEATRPDIWNSADSLGDWCGPPLDMSASPQGFLLGLQAGYDIQRGNFVYGIVADAALAGIDGEFENNINRGPTTYNSFEVSYEWLATLRARAGWLAAPQTLIYAHGGVAFADISLENLNPNGNGSLADIHFDNVETGGVIGIGAEHAVTSSLSVFIEYSFMDFGDYEGEFTFDPWQDSDDGEGTWREANGGVIGGSNSLSLLKLGVNLRY